MELDRSYDSLFNVKFVGTIKKFPCVYDSTCRDYFSRTTVDSAWIEIARTLNANVKSCKKRWKNLRSVFVRNVAYERKNKQLNVKNGKKPYYLYEAMKFMMPFISTKLPRTDNEQLAEKNDNQDTDDLSFNVESPENNSNQDSNTFAGHNIDIVKEELQNNCVYSDSEDTFSPFEDYGVGELGVGTKLVGNNATNIPSKLNNKRPSEYSLDKLSAKHLQTKKQRTSTTDDADEQFLLSLKPDLQALSHAQKLRFKREMFILLEKMSQEDPLLFQET